MLLVLIEEKFFCKIYNLLKKQVAKDIGVVESVYSEWENGKLSIPTKRIFQLANYFEVNIDYMLGISNNRTHIKSNCNIDDSILVIPQPGQYNPVNSFIGQFIWK